jgi:cyclase
LAAQSIYGYASAVRLGNQLRVINTEKHFDHIGGNAFFLERGIEVWGHSGIARTHGEFQEEIAGFNAAIPNAARRQRGEASAFFWQTRMANPNRQIERDTCFDLGGLTAEILLTPGHTPTNLSVWVPQDRVLFTGDCLIREYLPNLDAGTPSDWQTWLESLARLEALQPAIVVPGHGPVARGDGVGLALETVRRVLLESIKRGSSPTVDRCGTG